MTQTAPVAPGAFSPSPTLTEQLAGFLVGTRARDVPDEVRATTALFFLDWLGCAIAGLATRPGEILLRHTASQPAGPATALGLPTGRTAQVAALHNGGISHIVEMDDVDREAVIHPGAVVIPAAWAVAEQLGRSGRDLLAAIALGYEVACRIGSAVGKTHYYYWHNTSTCGVFGAAAAAGWLLGLDREQMVWALGSAGTQASGLWEFNSDGTMSKHLHTGRAAANGVLAAELAGLGFTGARAILDGPRGFFAATSRDARPEVVAAGLPPRPNAWRLPGVSLKPYPSCRHTHAAVDAARALLGRGVRPGEIDRVEIAGYQAMLDLTDNPAPTHPYAARFSVQYCTARALVSGNLLLIHFDPERIHDPEVRALMARTSVRLDPGLDARYPREFPAAVAVRLRDGRELSEAVATPKGDPEHPLSAAEIEAKFRSLLAGSAFAGRADALVETVRHLDERPDVCSLV